MAWRHFGAANRSLPHYGTKIETVKLESSDESPEEIEDDNVIMILSSEEDDEANSLESEGVDPVEGDQSQGDLIEAARVQEMMQKQKEAIKAFFEESRGQVRDADAQVEMMRKKI